MCCSYYVLSSPVLQRGWMSLCHAAGGTFPQTQSIGVGPTFFWLCQSWSEMPPCAQSCCCRLSLAYLLHVRQVRDLLQDKLELRWLTVA